MSWECGECNAREDRHTRIDAVCHHCGKPLCREDQIWIADFPTCSQFAAADYGTSSTSAIGPAPMASCAVSSRWPTLRRSGASLLPSSRIAMQRPGPAAGGGGSWLRR